MNRLLRRLAANVLRIVLFWTLHLTQANAQLPPTPEKGAATAEAKPRLFVETRSHDLGKILEGEIVPVSWKLENRGTADLVIDRTNSSCGCTVVKLRDEEKVIRPGGSLDLKVEFNSTNRFGEQNKTIEVFSNDPLEPILKLSLRAYVEQLYTSEPGGVINLRVLRRGETAQKPLQIMPAAGRGDLTVTNIEMEAGSPVEARLEPYDKGGQKAARVFFAVSDSAALGPINAAATVRLRVGEVKREKSYTVRGEIVGDLTWLPKVLDATRQSSVPGKSLAPVTLTSTDERPFQILEASAGPFLNVSVGPGKKPKPGIEYLVDVTVRETAPQGPFGATLRITTDSLDQPVVEVPVFAMVVPKIEVDPAMVLLRKDGTPAGLTRRVRIKTADTSPMRVRNVEGDSSAVTVSIDAQASANYSHLVFIQARLTGDLPKGTHRSIIRVATDVEGAETIEIPVRIEIP